MNARFSVFSAAAVANVLAALTIAGCGGGSDGQTSSPPPPPPPPPTGGIIRTGVVFAVGPITGFGSVIVNGNTYDTTSTSWTKDGQPATQSNFSVGQMVLIQGTIDDDNTNAVAISIDFDDNVEGPVTSVDDVNDIIVVLGQTVQISANTSIDDSCPATLDGLLAVPAVEVSGPVRADGVIEATRIECRAALPVEFEVTGIVSNHNAGASTFNINDLVVDYSSAMVDNFPGGVISNDDPVEAKGGTTLGPSGELIATRVEFKGDRFNENEGDHIEVEGFITRFVSDTDFDVSGIPVTTIAGTVFEGGTSADLGLNLKIEAEGEFDSFGVLNATKIEIKTSTNVRATGLVDSVSGNTLVILGITINTDAIKTRFEDKSSADIDPLRIGDINANDYLEVRGQELPTGQITAFLVERDDTDTLTELRGFVEAGGVNRPNLTVLGVTVVTNAQTVLKDANEVPFPNADAFWAAVAEGSLINVNGTETGAQTVTADEIELEME